MVLGCIRKVYRDGILGLESYAAMLFTVPSTGGFLNKTILYSGFKNTHTKIRETRKLSHL
jgi:hypothetical protein